MRYVLLHQLERITRIKEITSQFESSAGTDKLVIQNSCNS
jgi:hypothetical protein